MQGDDGADNDVINLGIMSSGELWVGHLLGFADTLLSSGQADLVVGLDDGLEKAWSSAIKNINKLSKLRCE